jgi:hypothetical protein
LERGSTNVAPQRGIVHKGELSLVSDFLQEIVLRALHKRAHFGYKAGLAVDEESGFCPAGRDHFGQCA